MRALLYLTLRTLANGVKRATTSARRLIGLIFFGAYWLWVIVRPFERQPPPPRGFSEAIVTMPDPALIGGIAFCVFALMSGFLVLGSVQRTTFKPADVDTLFPTPISPRLVLGMRLLRDYFFSLIMPLLFAVLFYRPSAGFLKAFVANFPEQGGWIFKMAIAAYFLMAMAWVCVNTATSLVAGRDDALGARFSRMRMIGGGGWRPASCLAKPT